MTKKVKQVQTVLLLVQKAALQNKLFKMSVKSIFPVETRSKCFRVCRMLLGGSPDGHEHAAAGPD